MQQKSVYQRFDEAKERYFKSLVGRSAGAAIGIQIYPDETYTFDVLYSDERSTFTSIDELEQWIEGLA